MYRPQFGLFICWCRDLWVNLQGFPKRLWKRVRNFPPPPWRKLILQSPVTFGRIHMTNFKTLSSTKALQKLCAELYQSPAKALHEAPYKAPQKLHQRLCSTSAHPVYWPRGKLSTQCAGGSKRASPWSSARSSARSFTQSPIRSSKALLTRSTNILGRFCNRPYNRPYNQSPYNRLYERLYERLYKRLHDRPYKRPYNRSIDQLPIRTPVQTSIQTPIRSIN